MLSTNSLSAFSTSNTVGSLNGTGPVKLVRSLSDAAPTAGTAAAPPVQQVQPLGTATQNGGMPTRMLPRGSLLDLSV